MFPTLAWPLWLTGPFVLIADVVVDFLDMIGIKTGLCTVNKTYVKRYGPATAYLIDIGVDVLWMAVLSLAVAFAWQPLIRPVISNVLNPAPPAVNLPAVIVVPSQTKTLTATPSPTETLTPKPTVTVSVITATPTVTAVPTASSTSTVTTANCKVLSGPLSHGEPVPPEAEMEILYEFRDLYPDLFFTSMIWTRYPSVEGGVWMVLEVAVVPPTQPTPEPLSIEDLTITKFCVREGGGFILLPP